MQNIQETYSDLFSASEDFCLVHCVSRDFHMGKGIALEFRNRFGRVSPGLLTAFITLAAWITLA